MFYSTKCSHGPTPIYAIKSVIYYASGALRASDFRGDLVINFTPYPNLPMSVMRIPSLEKYIKLPFKEVMIPWPDMGIPYVENEFWRALHSYIDESKYEHVCFHCQAGHGRTGTALAAMLIANGGWEAGEAVNFIRENYCDEAVESFSQVGYLKELDEYFNNRKNDSEEYLYTSDDDLMPSSMLKAGMFEEDGETKEIELTEETEEEEKKIIFD